MIRVRVHINKHQIIDIHAIREPYWAGKNSYHWYNVYLTKVDEPHQWLGEMRHKYSDGGSKLSAKMLYMYSKVVETPKCNC